MIPGSFYTVFLIFIGIALFVFAYGIFSSASWKHRTGRQRKGIPGEKGICPLCGTAMQGDEQLKSAVFPGKKDRICHIFGCPHCHPYKEPQLSRTCPVCHGTVPAEGYLIARMFDRTDKRKHVHILGCTGCRMPSSRRPK